MALEGLWQEIPPMNIIADSPRIGVVVPFDASKFRVGMTITMTNTGGSRENYIINKIDGPLIFLNTKKDVSIYNPINGGMIEAIEQTKALVPEDDQDTDGWERGPTNAWRTVIVDEAGDIVTEQNPFHVKVDGIAFEGDINVNTTHIETPDRPADSIRIGDGVHELQINPDGSLNVNATAGQSKEIESVYGEIENIVSGVTDTIVIYTATENVYLQQVDVSGSNVATFEVLINSQVIDKKRTYWGRFNEIFNFKAGENGILIAMGSVVEVTVFHNRPHTGSFNARIQVGK